MPLIRIELIKGRTDQQLRLLMDACHEAIVEAFGVPVRDRYQIVTEHEPSRMMIEDTGLGITRTDKFVLLHIFSSPRPREQKERFYSIVAEKLERVCGVRPSDVMISIATNTKEDWSFGLGRAEFLTGDL